MRRFVTWDRIALIALASVCALAWARPSLEARTPPMGGFAAGQAPGDEAAMPVPRIYFQAPYSADRDRVRAKLQKKIPMKFASETSLEEVLKAIKTATAGDDMPGGVAIYVDPVGLTEAEKTMQSPVTIDLDNVRIETGLQLVLKQLDLVYHVHPDGLLFITSTTSKDEGVMDDPNALILDRLEAIQNEVAKLRVELRHSRSGVAK